MSDKGHVDLATLEKYLLGELERDEIDAVQRHLASCARCSLELRRLKRFDSIESDEDLSRKGEWIYAWGKLERMFRYHVEPQIVEERARPRRSRAVRTLGWLAPAAAVAVVAFMIVHFARSEKPGPRVPPERAVMRGAPAEYGIELLAPVGEIAAAPRTFSWRSARQDTAYVLEVLTPTLARVYRTGGIEGTTWTVTDSLAALLEPNTIYLWSVTGYRGLERPANSPSGWFRIKP